MESSTAHGQRAEAAPPASAPFERILCGVDGSDASFEAVRQAACLAGPGTSVHLLAVTNEWGGGAMLPKERALEALARAEALFTGSGAEVATGTASGHSPWQVISEIAGRHDLLVVGRDYTSRAGGAILGSVASNALHKSPVPVLVAAHSEAGTQFPERIVVAADGSPESISAIRLAGDIACYADGYITLLRVDWARERTPGALKAAMAELSEATGSAADDVVLGGSPHREIVRFAYSERASLVIVGSRALHGVKALRSVSERVAHSAPCSVLVVRRD